MGFYSSRSGDESSRSSVGCSDSTPRRLNSWRQRRRRRSNSGSRGSSRGSRSSATAFSGSASASGSCASSASSASSQSSWRSAASSASSTSSCLSFHAGEATRGGRGGANKRDYSVEVPQSRLTPRALRAFGRSTEEHCRRVHQDQAGHGMGKMMNCNKSDVDFPTCLMVLPYELKPASAVNGGGGGGGSNNRRGSASGRRRRKKNGKSDNPPPPAPRRWVVANERDAELAERVGKCLLEVNAATARLSFHLRMHRVRAAHHGGCNSNPHAFEALLRRWICRSRTEPPHLVATEIVTYLNCHPRYLGVCREMLLRQHGLGDGGGRRRSTGAVGRVGAGCPSSSMSCGGANGGLAGGFCVLDDPDPVGAAAEELARATDDLRDCYREPTFSAAGAPYGGLRDRGVHYLYLVDEFRCAVASPAASSGGGGGGGGRACSVVDGGGGYSSSSDDSNDMFGSMSLYPLRIGGGGGGYDDEQQHRGGCRRPDDDDCDDSSRRPENDDALRSVFFPFMNLTVMTVASGAGAEGGDTLAGLARLLGLPPRCGPRGTTGGDGDGGVPESWIRAAGAGLIHGPGVGGSGGGGGGGGDSLVEFARLQLDVERRRRAREAAMRRQRQMEQKQVRFEVSHPSSSSDGRHGGDDDRRNNDEDDSDSSSYGNASGGSAGTSFSPEWRQLARFFGGRDPRGRYADLVRVVAVDVDEGGVGGGGGLSSYGPSSGSCCRESSTRPSVAIWTSRDVADAIQRDDCRSVAAAAAAHVEKRKKKKKKNSGSNRRRSSRLKSLGAEETGAAVGVAAGAAANQNSPARLSKGCSMSSFLPAPFRGKRSSRRQGGKVNASASTMDSSISSADLAGGGTAESIATRSIPSVIETKLSLQATRAAGRSVRGALMRTSSVPRLGSFRARFLGGGGGSSKKKKMGKRGSDGCASSPERDGYKSMGEGFDSLEEF